MSSGIPTFSARKTTSNQPRPTAPFTLRKPTLIPGVRGPLSTTKDTQPSSSLKRPAQNVFSSHNKFRRTTPLSLATNKTVKKPVINEPVRLEFNSDNFKTPLTSRKGISTFDTERSKGFNFMTAHKDVFPEAIIPEKVATEDVATSPIVDWNLMTKESEINSYKCKITLLERQIDDMGLKNSKTRIDYEVRETKIKSELDANQKIISQLNEEIKALKEKENEGMNALKKLTDHTLEQTNSFEKQQLEYETQIIELKGQLNQVESNAYDTRSKLQSENLKFEHRINELENELSRTKSEMNIYIRNAEMLKIKDEEIQRLRNDLDMANVENSKLKDEIKSYGEGTQLKDILKGEISDYHNVKEENLHLKDQLVTFKETRDENLILREKVNSLNNQIEQLNQMVQQKNVDLGEMSYNRQRINEWIQLVGADTPDIVVCQIKELKQQISLLQIENDSLKTTIQSRNSNQSFQEMTFRSLESELSEAKQKIDQLNDAIKKLNRKCLLYAKETASYKAVINSYESEVTVNFEDVVQKRLRELEEVNSDYKTMLQTNEQELKKAREMLSSIHSKEREIQELKTEIERIKTFNPHIYTNISLDTSCQSSLQTSESKFRVIHIKENPLALKIRNYSEEFNNLKEENCRLKSLVEVLESGDVADMTRQYNEVFQCRTESEKLKKKYENLQSNYNGLKDSFKKISKSFRETCYHLTGYKIDNIATNRYKFTHAYDPNNRTLFFEVNNNKISMLQESSLSSLQDKIDTYLTKGDSYPAFLAAFTLELFHNRTNNQSLSSASEVQ